MMLTVTTGVVALLASAFVATGAPEASTTPAIPPVIVTVTTPPGMSTRLISAVLAEAESIWRPNGVSFVWRRMPAVANSSLIVEPAPYVPNTLRLTIGEERGVGREGRLPLGWIVFDGVTVPQQEIYLSQSNAITLMNTAAGVVGVVDQMPTIQRETLLARAMGRALAHELGHYLLASKSHTEHGLMKAVLTAVELFQPGAGTFRIDAAQRGAVAARLQGQPLVASR